MPVTKRKMRFNLLLVAAMAAAAPVHAQSDLGKAVTGIAQSLLNQEQDRNAYIRAQQLNTVRGYREYLRTYPRGAYRVNAERALQRLGEVTNSQVPPIDGATQTSASREAALGLTRTERIRIQKQLTAIGYPTGIADGLWGTNTRTAVKRWQTANKLPATGYVTSNQVALIAQQAGDKVGSTPGGAVNVDDPVEERLLGLSYAERREVQRRLVMLGYSTGGIDGSFGPATRRALASWQRDEGLRASGYLTADQLRQLRADTGA